MKFCVYGHLLKNRYELETILFLIHPAKIHRFTEVGPLRFREPLKLMIKQTHLTSGEPIIPYWIEKIQNNHPRAKLMWNASQVIYTSICYHLEQVPGPLIPKLPDNTLPLYLMKFVDLVILE